MGYTLEKFASECHAILAEDSGVAGREKIRALLCNVLVDETFVAENFPESNDAPDQSSTKTTNLVLPFARMSTNGRPCPSRMLTARTGLSTAKSRARRKCSTMNSLMHR